MVRSRESYCWLDSGNKAALLGRQRFSDVRAQNGSYARRTLSASELDTLMSAGAKPVAAGMLLTMHDARFYMVEDHKMHDGKMLSEELGLRAAAGR
jgi:hypothetical protein